LKPKDMLELMLKSQHSDGLVSEYRFHPTRRWRFDWAYPEKKIAIEYEGVYRGKSRHTTVTGYTGDCEKYNQATYLGWQVYRFTAAMVETGQTYDLLKDILHE